MTRYANSRIHKTGVNHCSVREAAGVKPPSDKTEAAAAPSLDPPVIRRQYADVYHIKLNSDATPVIHAPRRVPVKDQLKDKLNAMVNEDIIAPVSEPTGWVSSLLLVLKPAKLRICMDPRDLNRAIKREHCQMPTLEEMATRFGRAKVFTVMDAKSGFLQVELDDVSSRYLAEENARDNRMSGVEVIADDFLIT